MKYARIEGQVKRLQRGEWIASDSLHHEAMREWKGLGPATPGLTLNRTCSAMTCESCYLGAGQYGRAFRFRVLCTNPDHYALGPPELATGRPPDGLQPETLFLLERGRLAMGRTVDHALTYQLATKRQSVKAFTRSVSALEMARIHQEGRSA